jgi:hypothetical protein
LCTIITAKSYKPYTNNTTNYPKTKTNLPQTMAPFPALAVVEYFIKQKLTARDSTMFPSTTLETAISSHRTTTATSSSEPSGRGNASISGVRPPTTELGLIFLIFFVVLASLFFTRRGYLARKQRQQHSVLENKDIDGSWSMETAEKQRNNYSEATKKNKQHFGWWKRT